jgi:Ca2+-binding EF-hand superfamily protein
MKKVGKKYGYDDYLLFIVFDLDKKGFVTPADLYKVFSEIGLKCEVMDIEQAFEEMDLNKNN